jgi:hypothetical protein
VAVTVVVAGVQPSLQLPPTQMQDVPVALGSSGKTIKSEANDRVFVYYRWVPVVICMDVGCARVFFWHWR